MKLALSTRFRSQIACFLESITALILKVGVPVLVISTIYLAYAVFGGGIRSMAEMSKGDRSYLIYGVSMAVKALQWSSIAVVAALVVRFFYEDVLGQVLAVTGAVLFFLGPYAFGDIAARYMITGNWLYNTIARAFIYLGTVYLLPGLFLVIRDAIWRILNNISERQEIMSCWGDEDRRRQQFQKKCIYGKCWDLPYCRDFVKSMCPAFKSKKPCWQLKLGCYCDENTILSAMLTNGKSDVQAKGILQSLGLGESTGRKISNKAKRARCRRCSIYSEHQRQKYRIATPMVFPMVALAFIIFYNVIYSRLYEIIIRADRFMSILTYKPGGHVTSFAGDAHMLTVLAVVWLAVFTLSYSLRAVEYLILDLQV